MSSLAELPEVIGFFSYSREDDESFTGMLSALRDGIQRELSAQLGRSKKTLRLWQDQEAIAPGTLWESEIATAVEQSVFFIPIVTPRAVNSGYCDFEFKQFLARERALGRNDLVFPILYITVPALEDETQWRDHPVLSVIGRRQYVDWRQFRHLDVHSTAVREAIERLCTKIVAALSRSWVSLEDRRRLQEAEAHQRAESERRRREADERQRAAEEARARKIEAEAKRVAEERQRQAAEAKRSAQEPERGRDAIVEEWHATTRGGDPAETRPGRRGLGGLLTKSTRPLALGIGLLAAFPLLVWLSFSWLDQMLNLSDLVAAEGSSLELSYPGYTPLLIGYSAAIVVYLAAAAVLIGKAVASRLSLVGWRATGFWVASLAVGIVLVRLCRLIVPLQIFYLP